MPEFLRRSAFTLSFFVAGCHFFDPAGAAFEEAQELAESGDYLEAFQLYAQIERTWPDSPEAQQLPAAIDAAFTGWVDQSIDNSDYQGISFMLEHLAGSGSDIQVPDKTWVAAKLGQAMDEGPEADATLGLLGEAMDMGPPSEIRADLLAWTCEHATEFPQAASCLEEQGPPCKEAAVVADWCPTPDLEAAVSSWKEAVLHESQELLAELERLDTACSHAKTQLRQIEDRYLARVLRDDMSAMAAVVVEQRPHNQVVTEGRDRMEEVSRSLPLKGWPEEATQAIAEQVRSSACQW